MNSEPVDMSHKFISLEITRQDIADLYDDEIAQRMTDEDMDNLAYRIADNYRESLLFVDIKAIMGNNDFSHVFEDDFDDDLAVCYVCANDIPDGDEIEMKMGVMCEACYQAGDFGDDEEDEDGPDFVDLS